MAKDRRNKQGNAQTRLVDETKTRSKPKTKRKKNSVAQIVVKSLLATVALVGLIFLIVLGKYLFELFSTDTDTPTNVVQHDTTEQANKNKVAYYLVGLLGDELGDDTQGLMLVCHDKKAKTVNMLQIPRDTYLGKDDGFAVQYIGGVWSNPKPLPWCETCRCRVYEPETEGDKHSVCGTKITEKTGSSVENLIEVFNDQYSMPIDGYFLFPAKGLSQLVDDLGGVTLKLDSTLKVGEVTYNAGVRTLDGAAALEYMTKDGDTISGDVSRLVRQRDVIGAVCTRLFALDNKTLEDTLNTLMKGKYPIRTDVSIENMVKLVQDWNKVTTTNMTAFIIPGESVKSGSKQYYSLHTDSLVKLFNDKFNPYGVTIEASHLQVTELKAPSKDSDLQSETLAKDLQEQEKLAEETDPSTAQ